MSGRGAARPAGAGEPRVAADGAVARLGAAGPGGGGPGAARGGAEPCLHCGHPVPARLMGCKGGHCPNCRHPYPHGDCSD